MQKNKDSFYKDIEIRFYDCDRKKRCHIETILRYLADIAGLAYADKGYTHTWLWENGIVFLVSRMAIRMKRMPAPDEKLTVETWEQEIKGMQFLRSFEIWDEAGNSIVEAITSWIMVNPQTRSLMRPDEFAGRKDHFSNRPYPQTLPCARMKPPAELIEVGQRQIRYSDIDANGHTYNAVYAGIACDFMPEEMIFQTMKDFRINFRQEALLGETLTIYRAIKENVAVIVGKLGETVSFEAEFTFE